MVGSHIVGSTEAAYLAGIIDGEGSVSIIRYKVTHGRGQLFSARVSISMQDEGVLRWLHELTGLGNLRFQQRGVKNPIWQWQLTTRHAADLLKLALPFLRVKRTQAEKVIEFAAGVKPQGHGRKPMPEEEWDRQVGLFREVWHINHRGTDAPV